MRRYLKEFLSDRRVIELPRWKWWPILNLIILTRPPRPQGQGLRQDLEQGAQRGPAQDHHALAGREAGTPCSATSASSSTGPCATPIPPPPPAHRAAAAQGCDRLLLVPLYPQYAAATTATACDEAFRALMRLRWQPAVRVAPPYYDDPVYIDAAGRLDSRATSPTLDFEPEALIASFHGMPQRYLDAGDPYHCQCQKTVAAGARDAGLAQRALAHDLPVALRQRAVAAALHHRDGGAAGQVRRQTPRHRRARLLRRLPGDAGGARRLRDWSARPLEEGRQTATAS